jgi:hypothetical protein
VKKRLRIVRQHVVAHRGVIAIVAVAALCCLFTIFLFAPGYMSNDSTEQLSQARSLELSDHHPITMALLWRVLDQLVPGPLGMLVVMSLLYWAGLAAFFHTRPWPLALRALALPLMGFFPPVFCIAGAIWKDTLMQGTLLAALGCFLLYERGRSRALLFLGLVLTLFGLSVRHNAIGAAWPILALPLLTTPFLHRFRLGYRVLLAGGASLAIAAVSIALLLKALSPLAKPAHFWQMIATFDLAGISARTGKLEVDPASGVLNSGVRLREIRRAYQPRNHMSLYKCASRRHRPCQPPFVRVAEPEQLARLGSNWWSVVRHHPREYLQHRYGVYKLVSGIGGTPAKLWFLKQPGLARNYPLSARGEAALDWFRSLSDTRWFAVWLYVALAFAVGVAGIPFLVRTGSALPLVLSLSSIGYAASLFFGTGAQDYRYSVWTVLTAVLGLLALLQSWRPKPVVAESAR